MYSAVDLGLVVLILVFTDVPNGDNCGVGGRKAIIFEIFVIFGIVVTIGVLELLGRSALEVR